MSIAIAGLMCLTLAACYQETDVLNATTSQEKGVSKVQQQQTAEKTEVEKEDKTDVSNETNMTEEKSASTSTTSTQKQSEDTNSNVDPSTGIDMGTEVESPMKLTVIQSSTIQKVTLLTPDTPENLFQATYKPQEIEPEKGKKMLSAMNNGKWKVYTQQPILWIVEDPLYPDYAVLIETGDKTTIIHFCEDFNDTGFVVIGTLPKGVSYADYIETSHGKSEFAFYTTTSETYNEMLNALLK